jgi:hypothetical protein
MRRLDMLKIFLCAAMGLSSAISNRADAAAAGNALDFSIHQDFVTPRSLGMGGAHTAVADDYGTLFFNPAGLARLDSGQINLELRLSADPKTSSLINDINRVGKNNNTQEVVNLLESLYGNHYSSRLPTIGSYWVRPRWGFAFIPFDLSLDMSMHQIAGASINLVAYQDTVFAMGVAKNYDWLGAGHELSLGITPKFVYRGYFNKAVPATELAGGTSSSSLLKSEDVNEGLALDANVGALWTPEKWSFWQIKPTFGFSVSNIVDSGFIANAHILDKNSATPPKLGRRFNFGTMLELPDWWVWKSRFAFDLRDMGPNNWTFKKGSHLGLEFLWKVRTWFRGGWRVGLNQGYFTTGFTGKIGIAQLDLTTYAEEYGTSDAPATSRQWMAKVSIDW